MVADRVNILNTKKADVDLSFNDMPKQNITTVDKKVNMSKNLEVNSINNINPSTRVNDRTVTNADNKVPNITRDMSSVNISKSKAIISKNIASSATVNTVSRPTIANTETINNVKTNDTTVNATENTERTRTLEQAFAELKQARTEFELENSNKKHTNRKTKKKTYDVYYSGSIKKSKRAKAINQDKLTFKEWVKYRLNKLRYDKQEIKKLSLITVGVFAVCITVVSTNYIFAQYSKEEEIKQKIATNVFETNSEALNLQKIIIENVEVTKSKTIVEDEEREIPFNVTRQENPNLPKGEEKIVTEGQFGTKLVDCIKSYEDNKYIEEKILEETVSVEPVTEVIEVGTSEYLAKYKVHIGDTMYVNETLNLKQTAADTAENICIILDTLDVKLEELAGDWCKVTYQDYTGYVKADKLTSEALTPGIGEKSRTQKLYATLDANMDLTKPSGLTLEDYKTILSGHPSDIYKIIENNAENFYNAEKKFGVNGIFLAAIAIHESGWGTSKIAKEKKNLFGFGAYDRSPFESANSFTEYSDGIDAVAKYLAKNYLYKAGTKISDTEMATGLYYSGPTIAGVNTRYCTDKEWSTKIFKYMDMLYSRL